METNDNLGSSSVKTSADTRRVKRRPHVFAMIVAVLIPLLIGCFSAFLTSEDMVAYEAMNKPPLAPPGWVFPIVWTVLYVLMGVASYLVYVSDADADARRKALMFYAAQLIMNFFWSTLFFTYERYLTALIWLLIMWVLVIVCVIRFYKICHAAGIMMGALFLWTTFAAYLNLACYTMSLTSMLIIKC